MPRLDITDSDNLVEGYFVKRLEKAAQRLHRSSQKCYLQFCKDASLQPLPASEAVYIVLLFCISDKRGTKASDNQGLLVGNLFPSHC